MQTEPRTVTIFFAVSFTTVSSVHLHYNKFYVDSRVAGENGKDMLK